MNSCETDCNYPSAYWVKTVTARKPHVCCECGSTIDPRETYTIRSGVWDGAFDRFKQCNLCSRAWDDLMQELDNEACIPFGGLWEWTYDLEETSHAAI